MHLCLLFYYAFLSNKSGHSAPVGMKPWIWPNASMLTGYVEYTSSGRTSNSFVLGVSLIAGTVIGSVFFGGVGILPLGRKEDIVSQTAK